MDPCGQSFLLYHCLILPGNLFIQCIEVARTPKVEHAKGKSKSKSKPKDKGKEKDLSASYEYEDGSVHDNALHAHILKGYERFKVGMGFALQWRRSLTTLYLQLTHGSFTSILVNIGQQALELQLERFFTVWAWSWNLEDGHDFGESFGEII